MDETARENLARARTLLADVTPGTVSELIALAQAHVFLGLLADALSYRAS